jgi:SAM-dependent methyltransferase
MRPDEQKSAEQFDREAHEYAGRYANRDPNGHSFRARRDQVRSLLGGGSLGDVLDIGGASGVYYHAFRDQARAYHVVDISPRMIELAKGLEDGTGKLRLHVASCYDLPFPDGTFDTVIGMGLLEYLDDPWQGLSEMARVARPGAPVLASFPNAASPMRRMADTFYRARGLDGAKHRSFTAQEVHDVATSLGLEIVATRGYNAQVVPFYWRVKPAATRLAEALEPLLNRVGSLWGTSFIVELKKPAC